MKKKTFVLGCCILLGMYVHAQFKVQGVPYDSDGSRPAPVLSLRSAQDFDMDDILFWVGTGNNQAALVLQWNDDREEDALVWGYRWDGNATGYDMLAAIAKADSRLYYLTHETQYGNTVAGIGFDLDGDGDIALLLAGEEVEVNADGYAVTTSYNYDDFTARDADDLWMSGWYTKGYWSYYGNDNGIFPPENYASTGASGRQLVDGSVDGWWFAVGMTGGASSWKTLVPAEESKDISGLPEEFADGFFIQNEDWFGHAMGSINWVDNDGKVYYDVDNKANGREVLGNTSQYGQIYGDYYYVMSKQAPRLVVMDARTLEVVKSFDELGGGDGRAVLGIDDEKVYVGTTAGIFVLDVPTLVLSEKAIEGTAGKSLYSGQIGVMTRVGKHVFAAKQSEGVLVIDPETDKVVQTIENSKVCGLTVSRDGAIWAVAVSDIIRIDPVTLQSRTLALPNSMANPWGSWMADKMCADPDEDALYYAYGSTWPNGEKYLGKLLIGPDGSLSEDPDFNFTMPAANDGSKYQMFYGKPGIDPQSGYLLVTATQSGYSTNYSYNWLHYVDRKTGQVQKTVKLTSDSGENYYWFPAMPVFPDNHAPEINMPDVHFTDAQPQIFALADVVSDKDNLPVLSVWEALSGDEAVFTVENDGLNLTLTPVSAGTAEMMVLVNSNGRINGQTVAVTVSGSVTALPDVRLALDVFPNPFADYIVIKATTAGQAAVLHDLSGRIVLSVPLHSGSNRIDTSALPQGSYLLRVGGQAFKLVK